MISRETQTIFHPSIRPSTDVWGLVRFPWQRRRHSQDPRRRIASKGWVR